MKQFKIKNKRQADKLLNNIFWKFVIRTSFVIILFVGAAYAYSIHRAQADEYNEALDKSKIFNQQAQQRIVALINENEELKKELQQYKQEKNDQQISTLRALSDVYDDYEHGNYQKAEEKFSKIIKPKKSSATVDRFYCAIEEILHNKKRNT